VSTCDTKIHLSAHHDLAQVDEGHVQWAWHMLKCKYKQRFSSELAVHFSLVVREAAWQEVEDLVNMVIHQNEATQLSPARAESSKLWVKEQSGSCHSW